MRKIVCIGDSNTYGYDPRSYFGDRYPEGVRWTSLIKDYEVVNRELNGMKVPLSFDRQLGIIRLEEPDLVTVMLGTNDILSGICAEETADRMEEFLGHLKDVSEDILLISPPNLQFGEWVHSEEYLEESHKLAGLYRKLAERIGCMFADADEWNIELCFDGVHFSEAGHRTFAEELEILLNNI